MANTIRTALVARPWQALAFAVWLSIIGGAFVLKGDYESTAGTANPSPRHWPHGVPILRPQNTKALLLFAHPRCPCTRASLRELALIVAGSKDLGYVRVVFCRPSADAEIWNHCDVVQQARDMTGVDVAWDDGGRLAGSFGVQTSGHALLYDESGNLMFSGGITALRGHEGWNAGRATLLALFNGETAEVTATPVFGCPLIQSLNP